MKDDGEIVRRVEVIHEAISCRLDAVNLAGEQRIEGPLYVPRGERAPVVKLHAMMQMKDVSQRVWILPVLGQSRRHVEVVATREQVVENQAVDSLGIRINSYAGVKIRRARFDHHD